MSTRGRIALVCAIGGIACLSARYAFIHSDDGGDLPEIFLYISIAAFYGLVIGAVINVISAIIDRFSS